MKIRLDLIESRLRRLIEQWLAPAAKNDFQERLARELVQTLHDHVVSSPAGELSYTIVLHPDLAKAFERQNNLLSNLSGAIQEAAREAEVYLPYPPAVQLSSDRNLKLEEFRIEAGLPNGSTGSTASVQLFDNGYAQDVISRKAYLLVNGVDLIPLNQTVTNIGRRADNHIVISDPRVSRNHAQIRYSRGGFTVFDLNSLSGTLVNGQPIHQATLKPGDVINLCGVALIYGEESASANSDDIGHTQIIRKDDA